MREASEISALLGAKAWFLEIVVSPHGDARELRGAGRRGQLAILAYQGEPTAEVRCGRDGELKLDAVEVAA